MEGDILRIEETFDETSFTVKYQAVIEFTELPNLKLGKCEVKQ